MTILSNVWITFESLLNMFLNKFLNVFSMNSHNNSLKDIKRNSKMLSWLMWQKLIDVKVGTHIQICRCKVLFSGYNKFKSCSFNIYLDRG